MSIDWRYLWRKEREGDLYDLGNGLIGRSMISERKRVPVAFAFFTGFSQLSFGVSLCLDSPNIEIHLPFFFMRIGWERRPVQ